MYYTERSNVVSSAIKSAGNKIDLIKKFKWYYFDFLNHYPLSLCND